MLTTDEKEKQVYKLIANQQDEGKSKKSTCLANERLYKFCLLLKKFKRYKYCFSFYQDSTLWSLE